MFNDDNNEDDWMNEFFEENEIEKMKKEAILKWAREKRDYNNMLSLFHYFDSMASMQKKHVFYKDDNVNQLSTMLKTFIKTEDYEYCSKIRDWIIEKEETKRMLKENKNVNSGTITF